MLGFLVGIICLIVLLKVLFGWRLRYAYGWGHGYGGGCGPMGGGCGGGLRAAGFRRFMMRGLFERLDTTPGQEKVFVAAVDELREKFTKAKGELDQSRRDIAQALRAEHLDQARVKDAFARHGSLMEDAQKSVLDSLMKIHEALDDKQRQALADLIESGFMRPRGPFGWA